jgi:hypothetical protein
MDRAYIQSNAIALRYLSGKLSDAESRAFEAACAADPSLLDELDTDFRLKAGLERLAALGELAVNVPDARVGARSRRYLAAASVLAALGLAASLYLGVQNQAQRETIATLETTISSLGEPKVLASVQRVLRTRSDRTDVQVPAQGWLGLSFDASELAGIDVTVYLGPEGDAGGPSVRHTLRVAPDGTVFLAVNTVRLRPGNYVVNITPVAATPPPPTIVYRLRMLPSGAP